MQNFKLRLKNLKEERIKSRMIWVWIFIWSSEFGAVHWGRGCNTASLYHWFADFAQKQREMFSQQNPWLGKKYLRSFELLMEMLLLLYFFHSFGTKKINFVQFRSHEDILRLKHFQTKTFWKFSIAHFYWQTIESIYVSKVLSFKVNFKL